jgi:MSHA biogenesis protein MshO
MATQRHQRGITLIELITVISILGVIASVASVFIRGPIDAYVDSTRRAALTDSADTAMRRIARDIRKALPNSIRIVPNLLRPTTNCLEFIPTKTAGRYSSILPDGLNFVAADLSFNMMGLTSDLPDDQQIKPNDWIAVYNLGLTGANAYAGDNTSRVTSVDEATINIDSKLFPLASGSKRFYVIPDAENIVSYMCDEDNNLRRMSRDFNSSGDYCAYDADGQSIDWDIIPILASNVASCKFEYDDSDLQRHEPVRLTITFTDSGESISLYHLVSENNWP